MDDRINDLINRLRAVLAEVEYCLGHAPSVGADVGAETTHHYNLPVSSKTYGPGMADSPSVTPAKRIKLDDYIPRDPLHDDGFDEAVFMGSGDHDPLGHDAMARGRR